jgi:hypothetical protein
MRTFSTLLVLAALLAGALSGSASATTAASGAAKVPIGAKGAGLRESGLRFAAIYPARVDAKHLVMPVSKLRLPAAKRASVRLSGGLKLSAAGRSAILTALSLELRPGKAVVTALLGKRRIALLAGSKPKAKIDRQSGSARSTRATLRLTPRAARVLRKRLAFDGLGRGRLGKLWVSAERGSATGGGGPGGGGPGGGVPKTPVPSCTAGNGNPVAAPVGDEPPLLARPAGAVNVICSAIVWRPRESFVQYVNTGEGTSVSHGAANGPEEVRPGSDASLVYSFTFPFKSGWYDAASGKAALYYEGRVRFQYSAHGIDFSSADPEVELAGADSRAIFRFEGSDDTPYENKRAVLVDLEPVAPQISAGGKVRAYPDMAGTIPEGTGASIFGGFYQPGDPFGSIGVSLTIP